MVFYAASMTVSSIALRLTWLYAVRRRLLDPEPATTVRQFTARAFITSAIFLFSIGAAFLGLPTAVMFWLVPIPAGRILVVRAREPSTSDRHTCDVPVGTRSPSGGASTR